MVNRLDNVVLMRVVLVVLLVFYHAFAIYCGAWASLDGFPEVKAYWWLGKLSYAFMLELFVFVSGYVFGYQVRTKGEEKLEARKLLMGKFMRLMLPCMAFSLAYIVLLKDILQPWQQTLYDLINGVGHMWFLPILMWCFVGIWIIEKFSIGHKIALPLLLVASVGSFLPLPLRMGGAMYYMIFFYIGYLLQRKEIAIDRLYSRKAMWGSVLSFIVLFPLLTLGRQEVDVLLGVCVGGGDDNQLVIHVTQYVAKRAMQILYASAGIVMMLAISGRVAQMRTLPAWMQVAGGMSFGVYLFQQFILIILYYHTTLPSSIGAYWLPWMAFVVALVGSVSATWVWRNIKI